MYIVEEYEEFTFKTKLIKIVSKNMTVSFSQCIKKIEKDIYDCIYKTRKYYKHR